MNGKRSYWRVPSSTAAGVFYTVTELESGVCECVCQAFTGGSGPCWHGLLIHILVAPKVEMFGRRSTIQKARRGDFQAQVRLVTAGAVYMSDRNKVDVAEIWFRVLAKYVDAAKTHLPYLNLAMITVKRRTWQEVRDQPGKFWVH